MTACHILIFQRMNSFGDDNHLGTIHNALHNWHGAWEMYTLEFSTEPPHSMINSDDPVLAPGDMWKRVGFMRHAHEFWLLANLIVDRMTLDGVTEPGPIPDITGHRATADTVLPEYDQNNMRQVNELIASFENARIM
jgi:hypothetical protein